MQKQQVVVIGGGETFASYEAFLEYLRTVPLEPFREWPDDWKKNLEEDLGKRYVVIRPTMPNKFNAKYEEWRIWFERHLPFIEDGVVLVGHSLGGVFLAKYLSENDFPKKIHATHLVAAPFGDKDDEYHMDTFALPNTLSRFSEQAGRITIYHSKDDPVVPYADAEDYTAALPDTELVALTGRGHIRDEHFPELTSRIVAK